MTRKNLFQIGLLPFAYLYQNLKNSEKIMECSVIRSSNHFNICYINFNTNFKMYQLAKYKSTLKLLWAWFYTPESNPDGIVQFLLQIYGLN